MKVLITGSEGFIGKNLVTQFLVKENYELLQFNHKSSLEELEKLIAESDFICHTAGVNRPDDESDFYRTNSGLTKIICDFASENDREIPVIFTSSIHVERDNAYGKSKLEAESHLLNYSKLTGSPIYIFRLSHVMGKWCRPNYNSVIATFCYNISHALPVSIYDPDYLLKIVYIDDLVDTFSQIINGEYSQLEFCTVEPTYEVTVGDLASQIQKFSDSRKSLVTENVGTGFIRALYATYISYLDEENISYEVPSYMDSRGTFVEFLKTKDAGQFSFFTSAPGITRGIHYHHSKSEKFLVIKGEAEFSFEHLLNKNRYKLNTSGINPTIVETIPGWIHEIKNIGKEELVVMIWANEIFDRNKPDTYSK